MGMLNKILVSLVCGMLSLVSCQEAILEGEAPTTGESGLSPGGSSLKEAIPGVLTVKFKREAPIDQFLQQGGISACSGVKSVDSVGASLGNVKLRRLFDNGGKYEKRHRKYDLDLWYVISFDPTMSLSRAASGYQSSPWIDIVQPVREPERENGFAAEVFIPNKPLSRATPEMPFNDPVLLDQWHYDVGNLDSKVNLRLFKAWEVTTGSPDVVVAIVDYGVDYKHPDLAANMWINPGEIPGDGIDNDNNGKIDDIYGYNFHEDNGLIDIGDHGTHVAGTVAAVNNNGIGVCGIAGGSGKGDGVRLMSSQIFPSKGVDPGRVGREANAIIYAADNGAVICQGSWGWSGGYFNESVRVAIDYFVDNAGCDENGEQIGPMKGGVAIFAMGNDRVEGDFFPACYEKCIAVSGLDFWGKKGRYSNYSVKADIAAPGGGGDQQLPGRDVVSTMPGGKYGTMYGTSMACPHVSGVAALVISSMKGKGFTPDILTDRLLASCDELKRLDPEYAPYLGVGFIRADRAVRKNDGVAPEAVQDLQFIEENGNFSLRWTVAVDPNDDVAARYNVFYSADELNAANYRNADKQVVVLKNVKAGTPYTHSLTGIDMVNYHYFLVTGEDYWGNESGVSNVVTYGKITAESSFKVYPNPVRKEATIQWDASFTGEKTVLVYDMSGREVFRQNLGDATGAGSVILNLSSVAAGKYVLQLKASNQNKNCNILKI